MPRKKAPSSKETLEPTSMFDLKSPTEERARAKKATKRKKRISKSNLPKFADEQQVETVIANSNALFNDPARLGNSLSQYLKELRKYPILSGEQELEIARKAASGDIQEQEKLVHHNLRFVVTIAKQYSNRGVPLQDLIAEGNTGLLKAVSKFNPDYGVKFISYAVHWIGQSIRAALANQQREFRLPLNRATQLAHIHRAVKEIVEKKGRVPTADEISDDTGISLQMVKTLLDVQQKGISMDSTESVNSGDSQAAPLSERIAAEVGTEDELEGRFQRQDINHALSQLRSRDEKIIRLFFGLDGGREHTLEEIGILLGITRERVRQLRDRAISELREKGYADGIKDYH